MTAHRPHPISGPWPFYGTPEYAAKHPEGRPWPQAQRIPTDDAAVYFDPADAILFDGCERCAEHARDLVTLDEARFGELWRRMVAIEIEDREGHRTETERAAILALYRIGLIVERTHSGVNPWCWPWTYRGQAMQATPAATNGGHRG